MTLVLGQQQLQAELEELVDEAVEVAKQIKDFQDATLSPLEARLKAIKSKVEVEMDSNGIKAITGAKGKACRVTQDRSGFDIEALCTEFKVSEDDKKRFRKEKIIKYIKVTPKKLS